MKTIKAIAPKRITAFELGDAYCKDQLSLIIPFKHLEHFHRYVSELIERNKEPQPPDSTGYYITYRGTLNPNYPANNFSNNDDISRSVAIGWIAFVGIFYFFIILSTFTCS